MLNWIRDPDALPDEEEFLGMSGEAPVGGIRRMNSGLWRWEVSSLPGLASMRSELKGTDEARAKVEEMWATWLAKAGIPAGGTMAAAKTPRLYVGSYATIDDFDRGIDDHEFTVETLAYPRFYGVHSSRENAVTRMKEAALGSLKEDYLDGNGNWSYTGAEAEFNARCGNGTWTDGEWTVPEQGRPTSIHQYRVDGELIAVVVVDEAWMRE